MENREFHNPNMTQLLGRLGGLDEYATNLQAYNRVLTEDGLPDFEKMGAQQRADWERKTQPSTATHHPASAHQQPRPPISFVAASRQPGPTSYAALLQERRRQQGQ